MYYFNKKNFAMNFFNTEDRSGVTHSQSAKVSSLLFSPTAEKGNIKKQVLLWYMIRVILKTDVEHITPYLHFKIKYLFVVKKTKLW